MILIETSLDLFYLIAGIAVAVLTIFICWFLFYTIMAVRDVRLVTKNVKRKVEAVDGIISMLHGNLQKTSSYLPLIFEGVNKLVEHFRAPDSDDENESRPKKKRS